MRIITLIFLLLLSNMAFSQTFINGELIGGEKLLAADTLASLKRLKFEFPRKHYKIDLLFISHFNYDNKWSNNDKKIDLKKYGILYAHGTLDLVSYNKENGLYKLKLTMMPDKLVSPIIDGNPPAPIAIKGQIKFGNNEDSCFIEGKVNYVDNKLYLTNLPGNQSDCNIHASIHIDNEYIELTPQKNISVTIILE